MFRNDHPYSGVFELLFWLTPVLIFYVLRKSPAKYKLPKCYINLFIVSFVVYFLGIFVLSTFAMNQYDYKWYFKKYTPICMIICYIISALLAFIMCKINFKQESDESKLLVEPNEQNATKTLVKNDKVLDLISVILLGASIYACSNMIFLGNILAYPIWGILFFLHFNPNPRKFILESIWFFLTICFLFFLFSKVTGYNKYIMLLLWNIGSFTYFASILLHNSYLANRKKILSTKSSYLFMLLFLLPFLLLDPLIFLFPMLVLLKLASLESLPIYAQIILTIFATLFSYYWFLRLKKNILSEKSKSQLDLDSENRPEYSTSVSFECIQKQDEAISTS